MNNTEIERRALLWLTGAGAAVALAGCTSQQQQQIEAQVTAVIQQIQEGVANACAAYGKWVPYATSVLAVLESIPGFTSVAGATASMVLSAVNAIAGAACKAPVPPTPAPPPASLELKLGAAQPVHVKFF